MSEIRVIKPDPRASEALRNRRSEVRILSGALSDAPLRRGLLPPGPRRLTTNMTALPRAEPSTARVSCSVVLHSAVHAEPDFSAGAGPYGPSDEHRSSWRLAVRRGSLIVRCGGSLAFVLLVLTCAVTPSFAGWSAPRFIGGTVSLAGLTNPQGPLPFATDARGDVAIAWPDFRQVGHPPNWWYDSSVRLASAGPTGRIVTHTVWRRAHSLISKRHGCARRTRRADRRLDRSALAVELSVHSAGALPKRLGAMVCAAGCRSKQNSVLLRSTDAGRGSQRRSTAHLERGKHRGRRGGLALPGHPFGAASLVGHSQRALIFDPTPVFDPSGAAHVYGTNVTSAPRPAPPKPPPRTRGVMLSTGTHSHRFGAPVIVGPPAADALVVSFSAPGQALAVWLREAYPYDAESPWGSPCARVMLHGSWKTPVALEPHSEGNLVTVAASNGGGGAVGWSVGSPTQLPPRRQMTATAEARRDISPRRARRRAVSCQSLVTAPATSCSKTSCCLKN